MSKQIRYKEINPRITGDTTLRQSKIILGSFPTWSLAHPVSGHKKRREHQKKLNNDVDFYFGSSTNLFWSWYREYIDNTINLLETESIVESLEKKSIGITDIIRSCHRMGKSSFDTDLRERVYNHNFFNYPESHKKLKILCTSKGLLNNMLLNSKFIKIHPLLSVSPMESNNLQSIILTTVDSEPSQIRTPIAKVIKTQCGGTIECVAIPSPGSPYRKLVDFGFHTTSSKVFISEYLTSVFNWFMK